MGSHIEIYKKQLKLAKSLTGARWTACLRHRYPSRGSSADNSIQGWQFVLDWGLSKGRMSALEAFILQPRTAAWLAGALSSGRTRYCSTADLAQELGCQRVYLVPGVSPQGMLLVGIDELSREALGFFRILAAGFIFDDAQDGRVQAARDET